MKRINFEISFCNSEQYKTSDIYEIILDINWNSVLDYLLNDCQTNSPKYSNFNVYNNQENVIINTYNLVDFKRSCTL